MVLAALLGVRSHPGPAQCAPESSAFRERWVIAASLFAYLEAGNETFFTPILYADREALHLEARYNYEAERSGSLWVGWTFETGKKVTLTATPMIGLILGDLSGVGPGVEFTLAAGRFQLYSETEWVLDLDQREASFLYTWSQLTYRPSKGLRVGLVAQRTQLYETGLEVQSGPMAAAQVGPVELFGAAMNPWEDDVFGIVAVSVRF